MSLPWKSEFAEKPCKFQGTQICISADISYLRLEFGVCSYVSPHFQSFKVSALEVFVSMADPEGISS